MSRSSPRAGRYTSGVDPEPTLKTRKGTSPWPACPSSCDDRSSQTRGTQLVTVRRLYRDPGHRVVAGVASGIATHLGLPTLAVRIAFIALLPLNGLGALLYAAFWAVLPVVPNPAGGRPARRDRRQVLPFLALGAGIVAVAQLSGFGGGASGALGWLVAMIA